MIALPPSLAPWATELSLFPIEIAASLGDLVQRLSGVLGPLRGTRSQPRGEPDGFDGVARRTSEKRIVLSG